MGLKTYSNVTTWNNSLFHKEQHLAFVQCDVPYTNNMIERDFRHVKTKMKVSGSFRDWNHVVAFSLIYSFFKTCNKRQINLWIAINQVWLNQFSFH
ncbi:MAG: DDE-type integrase/transposase/recombinase [Mycoplasmataceae bacterium]|nr:DDE-type integrase/transposase/recombinase [Mycoplasmataceae bacterium]